MSPSTAAPDFAVTWDYRCPFARNFVEHVVVALQKEPGWTVRWIPFSLNQASVEEGGRDVWDDPGMADARLAVEVGVAVRDSFPHAFLQVHQALFAARHDDALDIRDEQVLRRVLADNGLDPDAVLALVATGEPREAFRREHLQAVADHQVFGVPTVVVGDDAVFVRVMNRPAGDADGARATIERVLALVDDWPELNELKHTTIRR
ncbi:MAG TPA: DsbA family protein [Acidimicrobiales bacterium]|nr:DsbA family protein [Acidimicrobiales bacterium]